MCDQINVALVSIFSKKKLILFHRSKKLLKTKIQDIPEP